MMAVISNGISKTNPSPTPTAANLSQVFVVGEVVTIKASDVDEYLRSIIIAPPQANRGLTTGKLVRRKGLSIPSW